MWSCFFKIKKMKKKIDSIRFENDEGHELLIIRNFHDNGIEFFRIIAGGSGFDFEAKDAAGISDAILEIANEQTFS